jgi:choline dehydrogenase-like flavoprotein
MPVASVHFDDHPNEVAMRDHAYKQGAPSTRRSAHRDLSDAALSSTHNLGTNRMSEKPRDGVVNKFGQTHDVKNLFISDGSQFTSGAACNPTLTIVSLAIRQADHIAGAMQRKENQERLSSDAKMVHRFEIAIKFTQICQWTYLVSGKTAIKQKSAEPVLI